MQLDYFIKHPLQKLTILFIIVILLLIFSVSAYCNEGKKSSKIDITSIRVGFWGASYLSINEKRHDLETAYTIGLNIDRWRKVGCQIVEL